MTGRLLSREAVLRGLSSFCLAAAWVCPAAAQQAGGGAQPVRIERAPIVTRNAEAYDIPLKLEAARQLTLVSHADGVVLILRGRPGEKLATQTEACRLESRLLQLEVERAQVAVQAAEQEVAKGGAAARIDVAKKDLELAQVRLQQTVTRVPFESHVFRTFVTEGQFVKVGEPIITIGDQSKLVVEAPVDRRTVRVGDSIELKVEDVTVTGKLTAILPLNERFDPLRSLFQSVASGLIEIDNSTGTLMAGQTAYSPMIPRLPVAELPNEAIGNTDSGGRKVQVIRDGVVRDVPVQLLGQVGEQHLWVSGRFAPHDEVILRSSEPLLDGSQVSLQQQAGSPAQGTRPAAPAAPSAPASAPQAPSAPPRGAF